MNIVCFIVRSLHRLRRLVLVAALSAFEQKTILATFYSLNLTVFFLLFAFALILTEIISRENRRHTTQMQWKYNGLEKIVANIDLIVVLIISLNFIITLCGFGWTDLFHWIS